MKRIRLVPLTAALLLANPATPIFAADDSFTKEIAALPAEGQVLRVMVELKQMNPGFSSTETHNIESGKVTELTLSSCSDLSDISPVRALVHLQKFVLGRSRTTDISPLKGMRLTRLTLWANPVTDLAPIAGMPIEWLNCSSTKVQDLSPLKGMPINELYCDSTLVSDFSPLEGMPLRILRCDAETAKRNAKVLQSINTLQTINGQPAQEFLKAPGAGAVTIVRRPAPAVAPPVVVESEPDKWTVIFRSADPTMWNTEKAEGDNNFAIPLKKVQDRVQYLRLRRTDTKDSVIVKMDTDNGRRLGEIMDLGDYVWNGSCRLERLANPNAEARTNYQLGIAKKEWFVPYKGGVIVLSQSEREGCSGWGFAKSALLYSGQAYAWAGKGIGATVFEIAVTSEELLPDEQERLLSSRKPRKAAPPPVTLPLAAQPMMRGGPLPRNIEADYAFTDASKPYTLLGTHAVKKEAGHIRITVAPGVEIRNGEIYLDREGELIVNGSQEKPAILHGVTISQNLNGYGVKAKWAIFDQCQFVKKGGWFAYFSSKWSCDSCLFHKSSFAKLKGLDFGIKLTRCAFVKMSFPEIEHTRPKDKPFDHMRLLRTDWNTISGCQFVDCEVAPTVGWCAQESNFMGCKFPAGETFESDSPTEITAFVADTGGDWPHRSWEAYASPQTALKVVYAPAPFSTIAFPVLAQPAGNATQKIMEDGKLRAWLSSKTVAGGPGIAKQSFTVAQTKAPPAPPAGVAGRDKEKQKTTAEERKPVVATVADAEMQKNAKPLARNQSSIKGLYVVRTEAGLRVGGSQDIIATAERASSDRETICDFVTEVGNDTDISMDEAARLLKVRYPVWQAGYKIRFSYSNKYSKQ
ncbi:MAG: hypothetical protein HZA91_19365, partial [Verrucomicrobia bacterium]|nr:hypothetical protein [Verrucomicrobiota bacterium]